MQRRVDKGESQWGKLTKKGKNSKDKISVDGEVYRDQEDIKKEGEEILGEGEMRISDDL